MSITLPLRQSMSASLIGRSGSSAFRLSTQPAVLVERGIAEELEQFLNSCRASTRAHSNSGRSTIITHPALFDLFSRVAI